jgi:HK97 gp10 family phage protein
MATAAIRVEVKGLREVQKKMEQLANVFGGTPMRDAMRTATLLVVRSAKINAPVDTGRLRASITPEVRTMTGTVQGIVGSNVVYAPFQEFKGRDPSTSSGQGRFYLRRAIESNLAKIKEILSKAIGAIVEKRE